ncbi:MAG: hypothetical protein IIB56_14225 [Planctomycetes bacterium]|nr:hypothetical protein [Planctomycetota bacterium]
MKKKNHIKVRFSTILLCIPAILLCAAPRGWAVVYDDGGEHDVEEDIDWLHVGADTVGADTTVNLYADVSQYIYVYPGSVLNIYSGNGGLYIIVMPGEPNAVVTVYGTDFGGDGDFSISGQVSYSGGTLTGYYGNGDPFELSFISSVAILLVETSALEVEIDIKPGGNPNSINLKSKGVVPVAVFTITGFNAGTIDPGTVLFAGASPVRSTLEDVDEDGDLDMLFHFKTQDLVDLNENSTEATLTVDGIAAGTDTVRIVQSKKE